MAHTLYAVIALAAIALLSFNVLRDDTTDRVDRVERVLQAEARGVLREMMEDAENRPFDGTSTLTLAESFGPRLSVPTGAALDSLETDGTIVDLDDSHGVAGVRVYRWMEQPVSGLEQPIVFDAAFEVEYVVLSYGEWVPSMTPTPFKRVTATVDHRLSTSPIRIARIYPDLR